MKRKSLTASVISVNFPKEPWVFTYHTLIETMPPLGTPATFCARVFRAKSVD